MNESWAEYPIHKINPCAIGKYRDKHIKRISGSSVNRSLDAISTIFTTCKKEWGYPVDNPVLSINDVISGPSSVCPVPFLYNFVSEEDAIIRVLPSLLIKEEAEIAFQFLSSDVQVVVAAFHEATDVGSACVPYPTNPKSGISKQSTTIICYEKV